jgi:tetratricopeptide (TPR) repeat protein
MTLVASRLAQLAPLALTIILIQGCVTTAPQPQAAPAVAQQAMATTITPQQQAELDAAMALVKAEQHEPAIEAFKKLALALPDNSIPAINLALVYQKLDKPELAEAHLKKALAIEPDNPVAGNELAVLYRKTGRFAEARATYEKTLAKYPHFAVAHRNLGVLCDLYLKDYQCAIDHYSTYALSAPNDKSVQIWIADLHKRTAAKDSR